MEYILSSLPKILIKIFVSHRIVYILFDGGGSFDMGSKVNYSILHPQNASIISDTDGILNISFTETSNDSITPFLFINKNFDIKTKMVYELTVNSESGEYSYYAGSNETAIKNKYLHDYAGIHTSRGAFHYHNGITYKTNTQFISQSYPGAVVVGWLFDLQNHKIYRYHNGSLFYTYDLDTKNLIPEIYSQCYSVYISNYRDGCNLSVNFGEKGLKYSYSGYTSLYDAEEYKIDSNELKIGKQY
jgi:hypothetical protein